MKIFKYLLEIKLLEIPHQYCLVSDSVNCESLGVQMSPQTPCWLWPCLKDHIGVKMPGRGLCHCGGVYAHLVYVSLVPYQPRVRPGPCSAP